MRLDERLKVGKTGAFLRNLNNKVEEKLHREEAITDDKYKK
jgi:hypothetical protein